MKRERVSTNFGWAVPSLKTMSNEKGTFTCPNDPDPKPIPALLIDVDPGAGGRGGITSTDAIFNRWKRIGGGKWQVDVQDLVDGDSYAGDAASNPGDVDLLFEYPVNKGDTSALVKLAQKESGLDFTVMSHKGSTLWPRASAAVGQQRTVPIIWMSFGANAAAGLQGLKGNPILLTESGKPGTFPFDLVGKSTYPRDNPLSKGLRMRHGQQNSDKILTGWDYTSSNGVTGVATDKLYQPRDRMNAGFYDGHVDRLHYKKLIANGNSSLWRGTGRGSLRGFE
jgi:prepilin-type processing-associated H-X9-DG protein